MTLNFLKTTLFDILFCSQWVSSYRKRKQNCKTWKLTIVKTKKRWSGDMVDREIPTNLAWIHGSLFEKPYGQRTDERRTPAPRQELCWHSQAELQKELKSLVIGKLRGNARVTNYLTLLITITFGTVPVWLTKSSDRLRWWIALCSQLRTTPAPILQWLLWYLRVTEKCHGSKWECLYYTGSMPLHKRLWYNNLQNSNVFTE